jgi:hypothetical protein
LVDVVITASEDRDADASAWRSRLAAAELADDAEAAELLAKETRRELMLLRLDAEARWIDNTGAIQNTVAYVTSVPLDLSGRRIQQQLGEGPIQQALEALNTALISGPDLDLGVAILADRALIDIADATLALLPQGVASITYRRDIQRRRVSQRNAHPALAFAAQ